MDYILYILALATAIWVYVDSKKYSGLMKIRPWFFGVLTFFFWLPTFPLYVTYKLLKYQKQVNDPSYQPNKSILIPTVVLIWIVSATVLTYYFIKNLSLIGLKF